MYRFSTFTFLCVFCKEVVMLKLIAGIKPICFVHEPPLCTFTYGESVGIV